MNLRPFQKLVDLIKQSKTGNITKQKLLEYNTSTSRDSNSKHVNNDKSQSYDFASNFDWIIGWGRMALLIDYNSDNETGTILAALIGYEIVTIVYNQWISVLLVFLFVAAYFATRGISYLISTFFITLFVLSLFALSMPPGATSLAQIRVVDTLIGAAISLLTVSIIIVRHRSLSTTVWQV